MFLKRLELHGFKSFAETAELELPRGLIVIVGPNGCGKSNIADAVKWVLGEQNPRILRGTRLEDIIFAGTERRKPLGLAEVRLTLDNTDNLLSLDYSEVTVARRLFRSGETEFLINKVPCRLKDIQELFLDTGLGRQAYSIIGQGQIDAVLAARPEERRSFFEETAGISKYKLRKQETLRKLAETEGDLARISGVLEDLRVKLGPLETEARKAETSKRLLEELKELEVRIHLGKLARLRENSEWERLEAEDASRRIEECNETLVESDKVQNALLMELQSLDEELEAKRAELKHLEAQASLLRHQAELADQEVSHVALLQEQIQGELTVLDRAESKTRVEQQELEAHLQSKRRELEEKERFLSELEGRLSTLSEELAGTEEALESSKTEAVRMENRSAWLESGLERADSEREALGRRIQDIAGEIEEKSGLLSRVLENISAKRGERSQGALSLSAVARELETHGEFRVEQSNRLAELRKLSEEKVRELGKVQSRLSALKEMEDRQEGYHQGPRTVLGAGLGPGILGVVGSLLAADSRFELAIESALGGAVQYVVSSTEQDAKKAVEYLRRTGGGWATFLPLNALRPQAFSAEEGAAIRAFPGVVGLASDLVRCEEAYRLVVAFLLGRTVIAQDLDSALALSKKISRFSRIVTLAGDYVSPGGAVTGGSTRGRVAGIIPRRREIAELEEIARDLDAAVAGLEAGRTEAEGVLRETMAREEELSGRRRDLQRLIQETENELVFLERQKQELERAVQKARSEASEVERRAGGLDEQLARWREELGELRGELENVRRRRDVLESRLKELREGRTGDEGQGVSAKVLAAALGVEVQKVLESLAKAKAGLEEILGRQAVLGSRLAELAAHRDSCIKSRDEELERACGLEETALLERGNLDALVRKRSSVAADLGRVEEEQVRKRQEVQALERRLLKAQDAMGRLQLEMDRVFERLAEYDMGPGDVPDDILSEFTPLSPAEEEDARGRVLEMRKERKRLEPVSLSSIDEYASAKEHHEFLSAQYQDLVEAQSSLAKAIAHMDRVCTERFLEALERVGTEFGLMFRRLLGGGRAELVLTDETKPLESGVEIMVQAPGKKLHSLLALSGGERALSAIALFFALLRVRPSPFCVIDEIDAALDDTNVDRFVEVLAEFRQSTQFIVVSHRTRTMEAADVLYGVTMEESGVSRLISVKLAEASGF